MCPNLGNIPCVPLGMTMAGSTEHHMQLDRACPAGQGTDGAMLSFHNGEEGTLTTQAETFFRISNIKRKEKNPKTFRSLTAATANSVCDSVGRLYAINGNGLHAI